MTSFFLARRLVGALCVGGALLLAGPALAQGDIPPTTGPRPDAGPAGVPIDGGASLLLAGGVAYGLRKLRQRRAR